MSFNFQIPASDSANAEPGLLDIVMQALQATGRIPARQPKTNFPPCFTANRITDFYLEPLNGGWVSTISFRHIPSGLPDCLGSPDDTPYADPRDAFLYGASILCEIVTGSRDLPFKIIGDRLVVMAYRA